MKVYSLNPVKTIVNSVKTITGCIVIVQGSEVEEYPVIKRAAKENFISWNWWRESMVFWEMQFFHLNHSSLNVKWETVVFFNSNSSVKRLNRGNSRIIGDFGLSWRYFGSKPMEIFWPTAPRGTWAGWQTWRRCIRSWRKSRGRWHTEQARTRPAWSPTSTCSHGSPTPEGGEPKLGVKSQRKTSCIHHMDT